ncbi:hypothetical protein BK010_09780 [Tenericutes bacterium MO-XQ]|nr:hypothetical protein BK010_09780 [Tenericutes bacterium MO-XQ]
MDDKNKVRLLIKEYIMVDLTFLLGLILIILNETFIKQPISFFNEKNNIFYLFSTGAQTLAGLFGLTMAGYVFLVERLDKSVDEDDTLIDIVKELKSNYFNMVCRMGVVLFIAVSVSLLNIITVSENLNSFNNLFGSLGFLLLLLVLLYIIIFIFNVADPEKNEKSIKTLYEEIEKNNNKQTGDVAEFLSLWNKLENLINLSSQNSKFNLYNSNKLNNSIWNKLKFLRNSKELDTDLIDRIDEMRRLRNLIVHGKEPRVSQNTIEELQDLILKIEDISIFGNHYDEE